jgi:hypothetical protein
MALVGGCSEDVNTPDSYNSGSQTVDLDDSFGGFLPTDETPAFGDDQLADSASDEELVQDGYEGLSVVQLDEVSKMENNSEAVWYSLTALWGYLKDAEDNEPDGSIPPEWDEEVEWNGYMELSRGGIKLLSIILFEREHGDVILPRSDPGLIEWESTTYGHFDGLRVLLTIPPDTSRIPEPVELTFSAGSYQRVFAIEELDSLSEVIEVIPDVASISFRAFQVDPAVDVRGFCRGLWGNAEDDSVGRFKGRWVSARDGRLMGWMRGHYGVNTNGDQVFFGKYVDQLGRFKGFLRGHYEVDSSGENGTAGYLEQGVFWGGWLDRHGRALGRLDGTWGQRGAGRGRYHGTWRGNVLTP